LEAIIFTADGDMRQALNNLQSTFAGYGFIDPDNVFKVDRIIFQGFSYSRFVINRTLWWSSKWSL
jgi:DNA polymerase III delta prime subunit